MVLNMAEKFQRNNIAHSAVVDCDRMDSVFNLYFKSDASSDECSVDMK